MDSILRIIINKSLSSSENIFDRFMDECHLYYTGSAHSIREMKEKRTTKIKGDLFEYFCKLFLEKIKGYDEVWLLKELPDDVLNELGLRMRDVGIDIIAKKQNKYYAVQCKYKRKNISVTWKELSTFYSLANRTGPFEKYIVMTNCKYVKRYGRKTDKDVSICYGSFKNLDYKDWTTISGSAGNILSENTQNCASQEDIRIARLNYFEKKFESKANKYI